jgi:hypothetical protein
MGTHKQVKAETTIRFSNEAAESCMGGTWKRIVVETKTLRERTFPLPGPLAYKQERGGLPRGANAGPLRVDLSRTRPRS